MTTVLPCRKACDRASVQSLHKVQNTSTSAQGIQIVVTNESKGFDVLDSLPVLQVGDREFNISGYPENGDTHTLFFYLSTDDFGQFQSGQDIVVRNGTSVYQFGKLIP